MIKQKKRYVHLPFYVAVLAMIFAFSLMRAPRTEAQAASGELFWGGINLVDFDEDVCDCGGNMHVRYDYKTRRVIRLYFQSGQSTLYSGYNIYSRYQLGSYSLSSQACSILVGETCVDIQNDGTFGSYPGTGTTVTMKEKKYANIFANNKNQVLFGKDTFEFPKSTSFTFIYSYFPGNKNF